MTFVLNLLHKDFSLLAADRQGNSDGPVTITAGGMTIHINGQAKIEGMNKLTISGNKKLALGIAGNTSDHGYRDEFANCDTPEQGIRCIHQHMESYFNFSEREFFLDGKPQMENSVLLTFFDKEKSAYFTNMNLFTKFSNHTNLTARRQNASPILCHIGSGSSHFEKAVGFDAINEFIKDVASGADLTAQLKWFQEAFSKVSAVAPGCGSTFDAVLSTRDNPEFVCVGEGRREST